MWMFRTATAVALLAVISATSVATVSVPASASIRPDYVVSKTPPLSTLIENFTKLVLSQMVCDVELDHDKLRRAQFTAIGSPKNIKPGGKYWPIAQRAFKRQAAAIKEPGAVAPFCAAMKNQMSEFYQN